MRASRIRLWGALALGVLALGACGASAQDVAVDNFPDLTERGYASVDCGSGEVLSDVPAPTADTAAMECWEGAPGVPFYTAADEIASRIMIDTEGQDLTDTACPEDFLNDAGGVACRAVLVGDEGDQVVVTIVVALADVLSILDVLPEEPTQPEIDEALRDAQIEVLIGTDPVAES